MRVCVVCHEASLTGAPRIGFDIALFLAESHEVSLLVKSSGPLIEFPRYASLRRSFRSLDTSHQLCDLTYKERVDHAMTILDELAPNVLYVNSIASGEWCEAGARAGVPVALHTHETGNSLPGLLSSICTPRILRWTDLLVGASQQAMDDVELLTRTSVKNHLNLGIFIDSDTVLSQSELSVPDATNAKGNPLERSERPLIGMCGLAQPRKGADIFLDLAVRVPQYDFLWIGPWAPPETQLNDEAHMRFKSLECPNFYTTGLTENPYAYLRRIDTFLLSSREDPNPLVVAEALLLGKKVMAFSETGASTAILESFGYAFTGSPDAERIAAVLPKIMEDGDGAWRSNLPEKVRAHVDGTTKLGMLQELLEQLVAKSRDRHPVPS